MEGKNEVLEWRMEKNYKENPGEPDFWALLMSGEWGWQEQQYLLPLEATAPYTNALLQHQHFAYFFFFFFLDA